MSYYGYHLPILGEEDFKAEDQILKWKFTQCYCLPYLDVEYSLEKEKKMT